MKEQMKPPFERGRKVVAATALAVLGSIGVGSCADQEQISWSLAVTCEEGSNPHITHIQSSPSSRGVYSRYAIECRDIDSFKTARPSVVVVEGPGADANNVAEDTANVEIAGTRSNIKMTFPDITVYDYDAGGATEVKVDGVLVDRWEVY